MAGRIDDFARDVQSVLWLGLLLATTGCVSHHATVIAPEGVAYRNGQWFDGKQFQRVDFFVTGTTLTFRQPARVTAEVDIAGGYVLPPFAEAFIYPISLIIRPGQMKPKRSKK